MCCVKMATPIHFIDGSCHMKCLTDRTRSMSHHILPLVINGLGADTHTHTDAWTKAISRIQAHTAFGRALSLKLVVCYAWNPLFDKNVWFINCLYCIKRWVIGQCASGYMDFSLFLVLYILSMYCHQYQIHCIISILHIHAYVLVILN